MQEEDQARRKYTGQEGFVTLFAFGPGICVPGSVGHLKTAAAGSDPAGCANALKIYAADAVMLRSAGKRMVTVVPVPSVLSITIVPSCSSVIDLTSDRPNPVPS